MNIKNSLQLNSEYVIAFSYSKYRKGMKQISVWSTAVIKTIQICMYFSGNIFKWCSILNNDTGIVQYFRECFQNYLSTPNKWQMAFTKNSAFHSVIIMHFPVLVPFLCWLSKYWILQNQVIVVESLLPLLLIWVLSFSERGGWEPSLLKCL